jgi:hypothetical protein
MSQTISLEERLAKLENEVAALKRQMTRIGRKRNWVKRITGTFKDVPEFQEVLRLGREFRQSQKEEYPD